MRIGIIAAQALLLAGDEVRLDIEVDATRVELVEPAGTVAYDMRGGRAGWRVGARLSGGAHVTWAAAPFVLARGAVVDRELTADLDDTSRLAWREQYSFGRTGEGPGRLRSRTRVTLAGHPALCEDLDLGPETLPTWAGLLGAGHLDLWSLAGDRWARPDALQWQAPGSSLRWWGPALHASPFGADEPDQAGR